MSLRLPRDKHDLDAAEAVRQTPGAATSLLPELLEWTQDSNWPVAKALAPALPRLGAPLIPALAAVLRSDDDEWKWHALTLLGRHLSLEQVEALRLELERLTGSPTEGERREGVDEAARDVLKALRTA